jgi:nicotinate-nucleotide adenylyltransferase
VEDAARAALSAGRFIHSRNTAALARELAIRFGLDARAAWLAGIAHDMAKEQSTDLEHGKAAAVLLESRFGIHNKAVLEAIEVHTTGRPGLGDLAKVLFIADKIEFSRGSGQGTFREMAANICGAAGTCAATGVALAQQESCLADTKALDGLFYTVLEDNIVWLGTKGKKVAEESLRLLEER